MYTHVYTQHPHIRVHISTHRTHISTCTHVQTYKHHSHTQRSHIHMRMHTHTPLTHSTHVSTCMHAHTCTPNEFSHLSLKGVLWSASPCPGKREKPHSCAHKALTGFPPGPIPCPFSLQDLLLMRISWLPGCQVGLFPSKTTYQPGSSSEDQGQNGHGHLNSDKVKTRTIISTSSFPLGLPMDGPSGSRVFWTHPFMNLFLNLAFPRR